MVSTSWCWRAADRLVVFALQLIAHIVRCWKMLRRPTHRRPPRPLRRLPLRLLRHDLPRSGGGVLGDRDSDCEEGATTEEGEQDAEGGVDCGWDVRLRVGYAGEGRSGGFPLVPPQPVLPSVGRDATGEGVGSRCGGGESRGDTEEVKADNQTLKPLFQRPS